MHVGFTDKHNKTMAKKISFSSEKFLNSLNLYKEHYSPEKLMDKVKKFGRKAGLKTTNVVLILYYATLSNDFPAKERLMTLAALGYFILPTDIIPDFLPLGFTDDLAALTFVLKNISGNLTPEVYAKAKKKLEKLFGTVTDEEIAIPLLTKKEE